MQEYQPLLNSKNNETYNKNNSQQTTQNEQKQTKSLWSSLWASKSYIVLAVIILTTIGAAVFLMKGKTHAHHHGKWAQSSFVNLEKQQKVHRDWKFSRELNDDEEIEVSIAVKQQNLDKMKQLLLEVSNPVHEDYGKFKTFEEVHELVAPSEESLNHVDEFLGYHGITKAHITYETPNRDFIKMKIPVATANSMFNTQYASYVHSESGDEAIRVKEHYQIHEHLKPHIDFVSPGVRLPIKGKLKSIEAVSQLDQEKMKNMRSKDGKISKYSSDYYIYPSKLFELYKINNNYKPSADNVFQVVASFLTEWYDDSDLSTFWSYFNIPSSTNVKRMPDYQPDGYGSEAELDVEYMTSMGNGINTLVWDIEDDNYFLTLLQQIETLNVIPTIVSMSYGGDEQSNGEEYCIRGNTEFGKISLMGCTFFASSGDDGSVSSDGSVDDDGMYTPSFPASSVFVTAVGGTYGGSSQTTSVGTNTDEIGWYNSGSGFSIFFDAEEYQGDAQATFVERSLESNTLPPTKRFRADGAGYPDLAAQSVAYIICYEDGWYAVSGTSCSSPTVAGMFSLIADQRVSSGLSKFGWLNPTLYMLGEMDQDSYFNDVVSGSNEGYINEDSIAFTAQIGWDAMTGWGTPKWDQLSSALVNMEDTITKLKEYQEIKKTRKSKHLKKH